MIVKEFTISNDFDDIKFFGDLCKETMKAESHVYVVKGNARVNGKSILAYLGLDIKSGDTLKFEIDGKDEAIVADNLEHYLH